MNRSAFFMLCLLLFSAWCTAALAGDELDPWLVHPKETQDGMDVYSASIASNSGDELYIACAPSIKAARVNYVPIKPFIYADKIVKVKYRVDTREPVRIIFHSTEDKAGTFVLFEPALEMVKAIYRGNSRVIYQDESGAVEFTLNGAGYALESLGEQCPFLGLK